MVTPIFPILKADGYHITMNTNSTGMTVLKHNPYIDEFLPHDETIPEGYALKKHWSELGAKYDKFINLTESIEGSLLKIEGSLDFFLSKQYLHDTCNVNYYDRTIELAGYPEVKGKNGELYFSEEEEKIAKNFRKKHKDKFMVLWALSGSAFHKTYPYAEYVAAAFRNKHKDVLFVNVGDDISRIIEFNMPDTIKTCGKWSLRRSMLMAKYADLVIGPETGMMNVSGCYETPKILFLSHSSVENLSKYWNNCQNLSANVPCQPCHKLIYSLKACPSDFNIFGDSPICMSRLDAKTVLEAMENVYKRRN